MSYYQLPGECTAVRESERAVLIRCTHFPQTFWVPKVVIASFSDVYRWRDLINEDQSGTKGKLIIERWWALKVKLHPRTSEGDEK